MHNVSRLYSGQALGFGDHEACAMPEVGGGGAVFWPTGPLVHWLQVCMNHPAESSAKQLVQDGGANSTGYGGMLKLTP